MSTKKQKRIRRDQRMSEECDDLPNLVKNIIENTPETQTWISKDCVRMVPLKTNTKEHQLTMLRFCKTLQPTIHYEIILIERIENPYLMAGFVLKREELRAIFPEITLQTRTMFHATTRKNTNVIIKEGFDWRLAGQSRGEKWGHGTSFSPHSDFAAKFSQSNGVCRMLMCLMLQKRATVGSKGVEFPNHDCDTTKSNDSKVFVKFDDYTAYPAYRITYRMF